MFGQAVAEKEIVTQNHARTAAAEELLADQEGLGKALRTRLLA